VWCFLKKKIYKTKLIKCGGGVFFIKAKQGWTMQQHRVVLAKFLNIGCSSAHHMDDTIISPKLKKKRKNFIAQTTSCVLSPKKRKG
jgi:hypothetical protein